MYFEELAKNDSSEFLPQIKNSKIFSSNKPSNTLDKFFPVRKSIRKTKRKVLEEKRKSIEQAILNRVEDGLEKILFESKGRGVIATKKFGKGEFVVEYAGELINVEEAKRRELFYSQFENVGCYMYYFNHKNKRYCVDATKESSRLGRLINHSKNGNLSTKTIEVDGKPRLIFIVKENIEAGCELNYDYGDRSKLSLQYHPWLAL